MKSSFVAGMVFVMLLCHAHDSAADEHDHEIAVGFTPVSWAWHIGRHDLLSDGKLDVSSVAAVGGSLGYAYRFHYFRVGPALEYIHPIFTGYNPGAMHEIRVTAAAAGVLPLLDDDLDLSLGLEGGLATFVFDPDPGGGTEAPSDTAVGWTIGVTLGATGWVNELIGLRLEVGGGVSQAGRDQDAFDLAQIRLLKINAGVVFGL